MVYRVLSLDSNSLNGLNIVFAEIIENGGKWEFAILKAEEYPFSAEWQKKLLGVESLSVKDFQSLHKQFGHFLGEEINRFIDANQLQFKVGLIACAGYVVFDGQLGDGAAVAALTRLPVVTDLHSLDAALGGKGSDINLDKLLAALDIRLGLPVEYAAFVNALVIALMGVLRWRGEYNSIASASGASRNSIGGALWAGEDA